MILDEILKYNRDFPGSMQLGKKPLREIIIFTCVDPRLVELLEQAMGISRGDASIIKNAGIFVTDDLLRSLAVVLFTQEIREILVVGHTDCAITSISTYDFTESMKKKGVERNAIPAVDIRSWLGGAASERERVRESVNALRSSPLIPGNVLIHGLLIDSNLGKLELVVKGEERMFLPKVEPAPLKPEEKRPVERLKEKATSILDRPIEWLQDTSQQMQGLDWPLSFDTKLDLDTFKNKAAATEQKLEDFGKKMDVSAKKAEDKKQTRVTQGQKPGVTGEKIDPLGRKLESYEQEADALAHKAVEYGSNVQALGQKLEDYGLKMSDFSQKLGGFGEKADALGHTLEDYGKKAGDYGQKLGEYGQKAGEISHGIGSEIRDLSQKKVQPGQQAQSPSIETKKFSGVPQPGGLEQQVERFEIWLEDLGIFSDDVKKELKRITGVALDDMSALKRAIYSAPTPQEAQKIKRHLQSLGAKAIIRRVKRILK